MTIAELKIEIFHQIDTLEKSRLEELHGYISNYVNSTRDINDWELLSKEQQKGIDDAILEIQSGEGIEHEKVMNKMRKRFIHG